MTPTITAFRHSPDRGRGLARDMRARWALEEAGRPYDVRLLSFAEMKQPAHLARHPFGQIPTWEAGGLVLFESGAIVLHVAQDAPALLPAEPGARARAVGWMFAAVNTVEPPILELETLHLLEHDRPWFGDRLPMVEARVRRRLDALAVRLDAADWLDGAFSAGDLMMVSVLQRLKGSALLEEHTRLVDYIARAEARPAFRRAYAAQRAVFLAAVAAGEPD